jgi:acyl carrier protein phosphodiesterase
LPYMVNHNWLLSYQSIESIESVLARMDTRMKYESNMRFSVVELRTFYSEFESEFTAFFKELIVHSNLKIQTL